MKDIKHFLVQLRSKRALVVFPHPDDEVFMAGGLIQRLIDLGYKIEVICLTQGGRGKNHKNGWRRDRFKRMRRVEFELAMIELGVVRYQIWDFVDGGLRNKGGWKIKLGEVLKRINPNLVISYGPGGVTGHLDHIAVGKWLFENLKGTKAVLLWPIWLGVLRRFMVHPKSMMQKMKPDYGLSLSEDETIKKCRAMSAYESQIGNWSRWQWWLMRKWLCRNELFVQARFEKRYSFKYLRYKL